MTRSIITLLTALSLAPFAAAQDPQPGYKGSATGVAGRTGMPGATPTSEGEIVDFMKAANDAEIQSAKSAVTRAQSKEVKKYAQQMIAEHGKSNDQIASVGKTQGLPVQEGELGRSLRDQAKTDNAAVMGMEGKDFDQAYIDQQVQAHQAVLSNLDAALNAGEKRSEEFTSLLKQTRDTVSRHLEHAQRLQTKLGRRKE